MSNSELDSYVTCISSCQTYVCTTASVSVGTSASLLNQEPREGNLWMITKMSEIPTKKWANHDMFILIMFQPFCI